MPHRAVVNAARRLTKRSFRQVDGRFLVEGPQAVREALARATGYGLAVHDVFVTAEAAGRHPELVEQSAALGLAVRRVGRDVMADLCQTVTPQGIVVVCDVLDVPLEPVLAAAPRLVALLAEVRDPGNAGSVLRAADAAGADAVVFSSGSVDAYNGKVVRASVGGLFHVPVVTDVDVAEGVQKLRAAGLQVLAADGSGEIDLDEAERSGRLTRPTAWVFGNEAWGLPQERRSAADAVIRIPIYGQAESLNLATAAALCLYASARSQRAD
ncbi:MAG: RNA methyltransferase [Actinomycetes bacterium]